MRVFGAQRTGSFARIALLIVLAFLGHDLLMTAPVAAAEHHTSLAQHHASSPEIPLPASLSCDATREAAATATLGIAPHFVSLPAPAPLRMAAACTATGQTWRKPLAPPGSSRAFLQVFRL